MVCPLHAGAARFSDKHQRAHRDPGTVGALAPKEVALVNSNKLWMTDRTPSTFGMPISGHAFGVTRVRPAGCGAGTTTVVRERKAGIAAPQATWGDVRLAQSYFPGTS